MHKGLSSISQNKTAVQAGQQPDEGGLAGVFPAHAGHRAALGHLEVQPPQGPGAAVLLCQVIGHDRVHGLVPFPLNYAPRKCRAPGGRWLPGRPGGA